MCRCMHIKIDASSFHIVQKATTASFTKQLTLKANSMKTRSNGLTASFFQFEMKQETMAL